MTAFGSLVEIVLFDRFHVSNLTSFSARKVRRLSLLRYFPARAKLAYEHAETYAENLNTVIVTLTWRH